MPSLHTLNDLSLAFTGGGGSTSFEKISEIILSTAGSFLFSNIPQTYSHLQVCVSGGSGGGNISRLQFNSDTASSYGYVILRGDNAIAWGESISNTYIDLGINTPSTSGISSLNYITIFGYTRTNWYKNIISEDSYNTQYTYTRAGRWRNTAAITQITISLGGADTYSVGTVATLYGIK